MDCCCFEFLVVLLICEMLSWGRPNVLFLGGLLVVGCSLFLWLYHLSDKRLHQVASLLPSYDHFHFPFLGFHHPLSEMMEVVVLISIILIGSFVLDEGFKDLGPQPI